MAKFTAEDAKSTWLDGTAVITPDLLANDRIIDFKKTNKKKVHFDQSQEDSKPAGESPEVVTDSNSLRITVDKRIIRDYFPPQNLDEQKLKQMDETTTKL